MLAMASWRTRASDNKSPCPQRGRRARLCPLSHRLPHNPWQQRLSGYHRQRGGGHGNNGSHSRRCTPFAPSQSSHGAEHMLDFQSVAHTPIPAAIIRLAPLKTILRKKQGCFFAVYGKNIIFALGNRSLSSAFSCRQWRQSLTISNKLQQWTVSDVTLPECRTLKR